MRTATRTDVRMPYLPTALLPMTLALVAGCAHRRERPAAEIHDLGKATIALRTDSTSYTARRITLSPKGALERQRVEFEIGFIYTNHTARPRYFPGCNPKFPPPVLEKYESGQWVVAFGAISDLCARPPATAVAPGETLRSTFAVQGFIPVPNPPPGAGRVAPEFETSVPGTYRLRWDNIYDVWDEDRYYASVRAPESERTSTEFQVVEE